MRVAFPILLVKVFVAVWAADHIPEKNPVGGVLLSCVGVNGALVMFESLLGTKVPDPDLSRRCDIMFPEGDVTMFEYAAIAGDIFGCSFGCGLKGNSGVLWSIGVGGVLTITGAGCSAFGGVCGRVSMAAAVASMDDGLSGEEVVVEFEV